MSRVKRTGVAFLALAIGVVALAGWSFLSGPITIGNGVGACAITIDPGTSGLAIKGATTITGATAITGTLSVTGATTFATAPTVTTPTNQIYKLATVTGVDVGAVAVTPLYTVPAGVHAVITKVVIRGASGTFDQATDSVLNIGWGSTASNVVASATYTTPTSATGVVIPAIVAESTVGAAAGVLNFNVTTAATASTTCTVDVFGYLY